MKYLSNGFSPKMFNPNEELNFVMEESSYEEIQKYIDELVNAIGHQNIADHLNVEKNRMNILLDKGDVLYIVFPTDAKFSEYSYRKVTIMN